MATRNYLFDGNFIYEPVRAIRIRPACTRRLPLPSPIIVSHSRIVRSVRLSFSRGYFYRGRVRKKKKEKEKVARDAVCFVRRETEKRDGAKDFLKDPNRVVNVDRAGRLYRVG